jgi:thiamine-monophosphate kinase
MSPTIATLGERALVERLRQHLGTEPPFVTVGIGDDAAVLKPERGTHDVVTTDSLVEGIHFRRDWTAASAIGHKALAVNLSDLAAMGATPRASLLSLILPGSLPVDEFDALIAGFSALAASSGAILIGGNLTRSPGPLILDVTAIGSVRPRRVLLRAGARDGQELYVTGALGAAAAGLGMLTAGVERATATADESECLLRYDRPDARTRCGLMVGRTGSATAAIDLSDGLADAARRLAEASGIGVVVEAAALPIHPGALAWATQTGADPLQLSLDGGEDYELAFAVSPRQRSKFRSAVKRCHGLAVTRVGRFVREPGAWLEREGRREPLPEGFSHF